MIEQAIYEHLTSQRCLARTLATYNRTPAVFNQTAPSDADEGWGCGRQYGRIVFAVDLQGDPARGIGATMAVDIMCKSDEQQPEEIEPIIRTLIHGHFFSNGTFTVAAQWKNSAYFTQPTDQVSGCTVTFDLLGFPVQTTTNPDVIYRTNEWTSAMFEGLHVINYDELPARAWKPCGDDSAVYWRLVTEKPSSFIRDTYQTVWRMATLRCHIFSKDNATAATVARKLTTALTASKRILKAGESPIMTNMPPASVDYSADPLRTGQVTLEATYGIIVHFKPDNVLETINYKDK